jgi:hypothetical protein
MILQNNTIAVSKMTRVIGDQFMAEPCILLSTDNGYGKILLH